MKIGNFEIKRNTPPTPQQVIKADSVNSYEDSVARSLTARGHRVNVSGRPTSLAYSTEQIEELYQGYLFAAIRKIANRTAGVLNDHLQIVDPDGEVIEGARHPYQDAVENADFDNDKFYRGIATYVIVLGEAFLDCGERTMQAGNMVPTSEFRLLQSNQIKRTYNDDGSLATYKEIIKLPNGLSNDKHYVPSNVIPITDLNPWDLRKGYGLVRPVIDKIALEAQATRLQSATIANMLKAPGIVSTETRVDLAEFEELKSNVETRWSSNDMSKAGTPITSNGGFIKYESLLEDYDKLAMRHIRNMNRDQLFATLGASKTILGIEESGTTRETSRVQTEQFILDVVMPLASSILNALNQDFINNYRKEWERLGRIKMQAVAPIEKDMEQEKAEADITKLRAQAYKTLVDGGMAHTQAARIAGVIDADTAVEVIERPAPPAAPPQQNIMPPVENKPAEVHVHNHTAPTPKEVAVVAKNRLSDTDRATLNQAERRLHRQVKTLDGRLGEEYVKSLNTIDTATQEQYIAELIKYLEEYYTISVGIYGSARAVEMARIHVADIIPVEVRGQVAEQINARLTKVANHHFDEIDRQLSRIINDGLQENQQRQQIIQAVRKEVRTNVETWQVERLVNTETAEAFRQGTYYGDKAFIDGNGFTGRAYKIWETNSPDPCVFCLNIAGKRVPFDENFYNMGEVVEVTKEMADGTTKQVYYPVDFANVNAGGLHPNCHCDYRLELE